MTELRSNGGMDMETVAITDIGGLMCSAGALGIKRGGVTDAALFALPAQAAYAGVFTQNVFRSACVESALARLHAGKGIQAVLVTSGNANAGTGLAGRADTEMLAAAVAAELGCLADEVIVLHTGVIGVPLQATRLLPAIPDLVARLCAAPSAGEDAARAMMTTDTFYKLRVTSLTRKDGSIAAIGGVAKGAGMIHPRLATMLSVLVTDLAVQPKALQVALEQAVKTSFNAISVDGDTSPNDSVILLASGSGPAMTEESADFPAFCQALTGLCEELAKLIVRDGEGATKFIEIAVEGAANDEDAQRVATTIATSPLVKTAFYGEDFNPGRIISAIGRSGALLDLTRLSLAIGDLLVFSDGVFLTVDETRASAVMSATDIPVTVQLGMGTASCRYFTCDLTDGYVRINGQYRT